jgi:hypothetical protein
MTAAQRMIEEISGALEGLIRRSLAPIAEQVRELMAWRSAVGEVKGERGPEGPRGEKGDAGQAGRDGAAGARGEDGQPGPRGEKGEPGPAGRDGEPGPAGPRGEKGDPGAAGRDGEPGQPGSRGEKGDPGAPGQDGRPGERGEPGVPGPAGQNGRNGQDGVGIERVEIAADGKSFDLVLTDKSVATVPLSAGPAGAAGRDGADGRAGDPGPRGEKGEPGAPCTADMVEQAVSRQLADMVAKGVAAEVERVMPTLIARAATLVPAGRDGLPGAPGRPGERGEDGANGRDGVDGLGFEDMGFEYDGERGMTLVFERAGRRHEFKAQLPIPLYRGVFELSRKYAQHDTVTYGGSLWIAQRDTGASPGDKPADWKLAVKRGRDAKGEP